MSLDMLFENFELLADAPNGVPKLREMILQLAVQGKLVPQDPNDEPASVLLEKIQKGEIKKVKPLPSIDPDEVPHELPGGWEWSRLGSLGLINPRNAENDGLSCSFVPMTMIPAEYGEQISHEIRPWGEIKSGFTHFAENDVVLAKITPCFQNGKSAIMRNLKNGIGAGTTELHVFRSVVKDLLPEYILICLKTKQFIQNGIFKMTGSAGQKRVPRAYFESNPFPLPPFKEQNRIVAKVEQLMAQCDELEVRRKKRNEARIALNEAALDKLLISQNSNEFKSHWQRIVSNFDLLYNTPETVSKLRQAILQLTVQGKLVPQDPNDGPASELLEKIKAEKEALIQSGKIKKSKPLPPIKTDEIQYELPNGWMWIRVEECVDLISGQHIESKNYNTDSEGLPYLTGPIDFGEVNPNIRKWTTHPKVISQKNDILLTVKGAGIGKNNVVNIPEVAISRQLMAIRCIMLNVNYMHLFIRAKTEYFQSKGTGIAIPGIGRKDVLELLFPMPPLNEQKRIVAKVDQLMALCDKLETKLNQSQSNCDELLSVCS